MIIHRFFGGQFPTTQIRRLGRWVGLLLSLILATWTATQSNQAPYLILFSLLYLITINFSLPFSNGKLGLVPIISVNSLFVLGLNSAVTLLAINILLGELVYPLWDPVRASVGIEKLSTKNRISEWLSMGFIYLFSLVVAGVIYWSYGGELPLVNTRVTEVSSFIGLAISYGAIFLGTYLLIWFILGKNIKQFPILSIIASGVLSHPFAVLGGLINVHSGMPAFVVFCMGIVGFSVVIWASWQRRYIQEQQFFQFVVLNDAIKSLREINDLPTVLEQLYHHTIDLIPMDLFAIFMINRDGMWEQVSPPQVSFGPTPDREFSMDDFSNWVAQQKRMLVLDESNIHFANRYNLRPPQPFPSAWMGVPLTINETLIGVMTLQRFSSNSIFSRWNQEMLLAIAGQASVAIHNALLHQETVRLYNLTDEALSRRLEQLQALINAMKEGVLMVDSNGHILLVNPMAKNLLNSSPNDSGSNFTDTYLGDLAAALLGYEQAQLDNLLAHLKSGHVPETSPVTFQVQYPQPDNGRSRRFIQRVEAPVMAAEGRLMGWLMLFRDITKEKELAEQRTDLTRMIVHDLRNPLTTLASTINMIESQIEQLSSSNINRIEELLDDIRLNNSNMIDMVDSLMDMGKIEAGEMILETEAMHMPPLVRDILKRLNSLAIQKSINLKLDCENNLPPVWADQHIIRRVLINLLDNALKFTPAGGRIYVQMLHEPPKSVKYEPGIRCIIQDNGPGIPNEFQEKIFNRFMRTNKGGAQVRGTGLGLTFCKLAITAHGGDIWVQDSSNKGSQFVFTLPGVPIFDQLDN